MGPRGLNVGAPTEAAYRHVPMRSANSDPPNLNDDDRRDESERSLVHSKAVVLSSDDTAGD